MTRAVVAVTTYRAAVTCDVCGLRLYAYGRPGLDGWLRGRGWVVSDSGDACPVCKDSDRIKKEGNSALSREYRL